MALNQATAHELSARLQQGEITARQLVEAALDRIGAIDGQINAFISVDPEGALAHAADIDQRRTAGAALGPLAGIPLALKDVPLRARRPHHLWLENPRTLHRPVRRHSRRAAARRRRRLHRQDQHGRVCHGLVLRKLLFRPHLKPLRSRAGTGWLQRRFGRGRSRRRDHPRPRLRHRRLSAPTGQLLRRRGSQAHLRPRLALRTHSLRFLARPNRPRNQRCRRRCRPAPSHRRARPPRLNFQHRPRARLSGRAQRRCPRP